MPQVTGCPAAASLVSAAYTRRMVSSVHMSRTDINSGTAPSGVSDGGAARGGGLGSDGSPMGMNVRMGVAGGVSSLTISPDGAAASGGPSGLLTISPDEEQLLKKPRLGQEGIAAAVAGQDVVARVDGGHRPG